MANKGEMARTKTNQRSIFRRTNQNCQDELTQLSFSSEEGIAFAKLLLATARKAQRHNAMFTVWLHEDKEHDPEHAQHSLQIVATWAA